MKLVILDRDGTLSQGGAGYIKSADEWQPLPGALQAVAQLNHAGWHVVLACNQSGLGRGLFDMTALNAIHAKLHQQLAAQGARIDAIFFCPHSPDEHCHCRKPLPGLFEQIGERYGLPLQGVPAVGDSLSDMQAAAAAGCEPHLVLTGKAALTYPRLLDSLAQTSSDLQPLRQFAQLPEHLHIHADLTAFAHYLLTREAQGKAA